MFAILLSGCASIDGTRPKPSLVPTAAEASAITEITVGALLPQGSLTDSDQQRLAQYLTDAKVILLGILDQEAPDLAAFSLPPHDGLHLRHVRLLELAVQIAVTPRGPLSIRARRSSRLTMSGTSEGGDRRGHGDSGERRRDSAGLSSVQ